MNNEVESSKDASMLPLSLAEIASWQVPGIFPAGGISRTAIRAELPALQRGWVWKPGQTERLWDSLLRRFPVGAFLLSHYNEERYGKESFRLDQSDKDSENVTHHLLDGQQRATSIALGFFNIWEIDYKDARKDGPALWLDLESAPTKTDEREFVIRLLTRSHPWGYKRANPDERLEASKMREALRAYQQASLDFKMSKPMELPLQNVWPWDAIAPIPLAFLTKVICSGAVDIADGVKKELSRLPFWENKEFKSKKDMLERSLVL